MRECLRMSSAGGATSVAAGRISYTFGLKGACISLDTACSSSLVATHVGHRDIIFGTAAQSLVGGVNLTLSAAKTAAFAVTGAFSQLLHKYSYH